MSRYFEDFEIGQVFRHAVQKISGVIEETLVMNGYAPDEIDLYVPHQANKRILDGIAKKLGVTEEDVVAPTRRADVAGEEPPGAAEPDHHLGPAGGARDPRRNQLLLDRRHRDLRATGT